MTMFEEVQKTIAAAVKEVFDIEVAPQVSVPDEQFGDAASNVALQIAKQVDANPREVAEQLAEKLHAVSDFAEISVAGPGFLNVRLSNDYLVQLIEQAPARTFEGQTIVAEYSDPNPFKVLHAGHLYTSIVGDAIANLYERAGAHVARVNFGGDVGMHVAKAMYGIITELGGEHPEKLFAVAEKDRAHWLSERYVAGNTAYESDDTAKQQIVAYNKAIYEVFNTDDNESDFAKIYRTCREWSYNYFNAFYERIGTPFDRYYPESECAPEGLSTVKRELENGVYKNSDGAVVFEGEKHGLHTRVFINSNGLPTYEAKDVGLTMLKWRDYHFDQTLIITGNDIIEYMKVVLKSIEQFAPELAQRTRHITHGLVKLAGGVKMSSRLGNFLKAEDILNITAQTVGEQGGESTMLAAVKYTFLKHSVGQDIVFDPAESVAIHGNSGPYLQYAHARARSILKKASVKTQASRISSFEAEERSLARKLSEYNQVMSDATQELAPHQLCTYLYELAQTFNRFYENNQVIGDLRESTRLFLVEKYAQTLKDGLGLLGIDAPESM